jgi:hypothetical protein
VVSEYGAMQGGRAGQLALLELRESRRSVIFRGGDAVPPAERWGDAACPGPPGREFSPHGIDLARRADGRLQLLVVQHGGRESVEFFEMREDAGRWQPLWRGCAIPPGGSWLNDVVALPDGGFLVTHMLPKAPLEELTRSFRETAGPTGHVFEWQAQGGFRVVPGTQSRLPNGIELSEDATEIFLNVGRPGQVWRIQRATGQVTARADVPGPDNSTWAPDGRLLVASMLADSRDFPVCTNLARGACPLAFQIVALEPRTLASEVLYRGEGAPMGGGTVGLWIGPDLLIGSFAGDRVLRVSLGNAGRPD